MQITGGLNPEEYDRSYSDRVLVRRISAYFRPHISKVLLVALMVSLMSIAATVTPLIISRGIDTLAENPQLQLLLTLAAVVTVLGALSWGFNFVSLWFSARAVGAVVLALREDAFRAVMRRDMSFYDEFSSGKIVSRVTSDTQAFASVVTLTLNLMSELLIVVIVVAVLLSLNITPGPLLFNHNPDVVWGLIAALFAPLFASSGLAHAQEGEGADAPKVQSIHAVERGLFEVVFCSIEIAGESPSMLSTSGLFCWSRN